MESTLLFKKIEEDYQVKVASDSNDLEVCKHVLLPKNGYGYFTLEMVMLNAGKDIFLEHYGNLLAEVSTTRRTTIVEETEDKISYKFYYIRKRRRQGSRYFARNQKIAFITINKKTKNIYSGLMNGKHKLYKTLRVNNPDHMMSVVKLVTDFCSDSTYENYIGNVLSPIETLFKRLGLNFSFKPDTMTPDLRFEFLRLMYEVKKIKTPNNFRVYINSYPGKKFLDKSGNKLVEAYMKKNKLSGGKIKNLLHRAQTPESLNVVYSLYLLLGVDYFNKLNEETILFFMRSGISGYYIDKSTPLNKSDKKRFLNLLQEDCDFSRHLLTHIGEHLHFRDQLIKKYNHNFEFKFTGLKHFYNEHHELSELLQSYKKGSITRIYSDMFIDKIEQPIFHYTGVEYYPVILKKSKDYNMESVIQNNCVRTYSEYPDRLIISLREGSIDSETRATIEFQYNGNFKFNRLQTLGKFNKTLSSIWDLPVEVLENRVYIYSKHFELPKMIVKKPFQEEVMKKLKIHEGRVVWDMEKNESNLFDPFF